MALFISGPSALEYWRTQESFGSHNPTFARPAEDNPPTTYELRSFLAKDCVAAPLHIDCASPGSRLHNRACKSHVYTAKSEIFSYASISEGVYVATPASCFVQLSAVLNFQKLLLIGYELCGSYRYDSLTQQYRYNAQPLVSPDQLLEITSQIDGLKGCKQAKQAVRYIASGSASLRESQLTLLLCLPTKLGGFGIPLPLLNHKIAIGGSGRFDAQILRPDLYWENFQLAFEYDSDENHSAAHQLASDSRRRALLESTGIHVVSVTNGQISSLSETESLAFIVAAKAGLRRRPSTPEQHQKRIALRQAIGIPANA